MGEYLRERELEGKTADDYFINRLPESISKEQCIELGTLLAHHFKGNSYAYQTMAYDFLVYDIKCLDEFWNPKDELNNLKKLETHLRSAAALIDSMPFQVVDWIRWEAGSMVYEEVADRENLWRNYQEKFDRTHVGRASKILWDLPEVMPRILDLIRAGEAMAVRGRVKGQKAIHAWRVTNATVRLALRHPEAIRVPKKLNDAGPFYRLLRDVFDFYQLTESPSDTYNSWRKYMGSRSPFENRLHMSAAND